MIIQENTLTQVTESKEVHALLKSIYANRNEEDQHKEMAYVLGMDVKNRIQFIDLVSIGTINYAAPVIRECFRLALIRNSKNIILTHNHPSGDTSPSREDKTFTQKVIEAGKILEVTLLDHIIFSNDSYYSFSDEGFI